MTNALSTAPTILLVEDDDATRTFLADNLTADGYDVVVARTAANGHHLAETRFPDLAIIDVGLPDHSGLTVLEHIRAADGVASAADSTLPVIVMSGTGSELDLLRGFDRGADDYVAKPFSYPELRARVRALLRRSELRRRGGRLRVGALELDTGSRAVRIHGEPVDLSAKEFAILRALLADPTRVFTKDELIRAVWGARTLGNSRTLDSHACRLRQKLARGGDKYVVNVWGVGYRLVDPIAVAA